MGGCVSTAPTCRTGCGADSAENCFGYCRFCFNKAKAENKHTATPVSTGGKSAGPVPAAATAPVVAQQPAPSPIVHTPHVPSPVAAAADEPDSPAAAVPKKYRPSPIEDAPRASLPPPQPSPEVYSPPPAQAPQAAAPVAALPQYNSNSYSGNQSAEGQPHAAPSPPPSYISAGPVGVVPGGPSVMNSPPPQLTGYASHPSAPPSVQSSPPPMQSPVYQPPQQAQPSYQPAPAMYHQQPITYQPPPPIITFNSPVAVIAPSVVQASSPGAGGAGLVYNPPDFSNGNAMGGTFGVASPSHPGGPQMQVHSPVMHSSHHHHHPHHPQPQPAYNNNNGYPGAYGVQQIQPGSHFHMGRSY